LLLHQLVNAASALVFAAMLIVSVIELLAVLQHPGSDRERRPV
jgi:hypothetical protein